MDPAPIFTPPLGLNRCLAAFAYRGPARELVARLKYRNARSSVRWLATAMAALVNEPVSCVIWVPTTPARRRERGFDQAELLARAVARCMARPCKRGLRRRAGPPQTGAGAAARLGAPPAIEARQRLGGTVLLVDDVTTTGATLSAAASAVRAAGADRVIGLVAARTPAPGDLH